MRIWESRDPDRAISPFPSMSILKNLRISIRYQAAEGGHVANNRGYRWRAQSADWMAERLS